jgi:hypothetical protein
MVVHNERERSAPLRPIEIRLETEPVVLVEERLVDWRRGVLQWWHYEARNDDKADDQTRHREHPLLLDVIIGPTVDQTHDALA